MGRQKAHGSQQNYNHFQGRVRLEDFQVQGQTCQRVFPGTGTVALG